MIQQMRAGDATIHCCCQDSWDQDLCIQRVLWRSHAEREHAQKRLTRKPVTVRTAVAVQEKPLVEHLAERSVAIRRAEFSWVVERHKRLAPLAGTPATAEAEGEGSAERRRNLEGFAQARRPPKGCAPASQQQSVWVSPQLTLWDRFGGKGAKPAEAIAMAPAVVAVRTQVENRQTRIHELEAALNVYEAECLAVLGEGTQPLVDDQGHDWFPVPPQDSKSSRPLTGRLRVLRHAMPELARQSKERLANMPEEQHKQWPDSPRQSLVATDARGGLTETWFPNCGSRRAVEERLRAWTFREQEMEKRAKQQEQGGTPSHWMQNSAVRGILAEKREQNKRYLTTLLRMDLDELLFEADQLSMAQPIDHQWLHFASVVTGKAYDIPISPAMRLATAIGKAAAMFGEETLTARELHRCVDQLVSSWTSQLKDCSIETLVRILETLADIGIMHTTNLDVVMSRLSLCHHCEADSLHPGLACRAAQALCTIASHNFWAEGEVGTSNRDMQRLEAAICSLKTELDVDSLAALCGGYVAKLCSFDAKMAFLILLSDMQLGFTPSTSHHLPQVLRLQDSTYALMNNVEELQISTSVQEYLRELAKCRSIEPNPPTALPELSVPAEPDSELVAREAPSG